MIFNSQIEAFIRNEYETFGDWNKVLNRWPFYNKYHKNQGTRDDYCRVLESLKKLDKDQLTFQIVDCVIDDGKPSNKVVLPQSNKSCFSLYKDELREQHFLEKDINNIVKATKYAISKLSDDTAPEQPVRGLFIGNVQSGKTANMGAVMSLAADYGYNLFIVFSGVIENLRMQTAERFSESLKNGLLKWEHLTNNDIDDSSDSFVNMDLENNRYVYVCLKNPTRLQRLLKWLNSNKDKKKKLKVLVIDDEADSASLNTNDINQEDWTTINGYIRDIVFSRNDKHKQFSRYCGMNYLGYTATPYANLLNEDGADSLYPFSFIYGLPVSDSYFGYKQFFGINDIDTQPLDVIRNTDKLNELTYKDDKIIGDMADSVLWFVSAVAALRYKGYKSPLSMLIHNSMKQTEHEKIATALKLWFSQDKKDLLSKCKTIYNKEVERFSLAKFDEQFPQYPLFDQIEDYPKFEMIENLILELLELDSIYLDATSDKNDPDFIYSKHIHLCIDNCGNNGIKEDMSYLRMVYPKKNQKLDYAPAFIVIGGNTLARGLTLKGLISTYFGRKVNNADSLMQMARWFGFRQGYELYPRIWLSNTTIEYFKFLSEMDMDLREQIGRMSSDSKPKDYKLTIQSYPRGKFRITSNNKMQSATQCEFYGGDKQLTSYISSPEIAKNNFKVWSDYVNAHQNEFIKSSVTESYVLFNVKSAEIYDVLSKFIFSDSATFAEYGRDWFKNHPNCLVNVILAGKKGTSDGVFSIDADKKVSIVLRSDKTYSNGENFNIGVLSDKVDYVADITPDDLPDCYNKMISDASLKSKYGEYRRLSGKGQKACLVVYVFKTGNASLDTYLHIGLSIVFPCDDGKSKKYVRYGLK